MFRNNERGILLVLAVSTTIWVLLKYFIKEPKDPSIGCIFPLPDGLAPMIDAEGNFGYEKCFDIWSVGHFVIYLMAGMMFPDEPRMIISLSVLCEIFELLIGCRGRLSDVFVNLSGYMVGSSLHRGSFKVPKESLPNISILMIISLGVISELYHQRAIAKKNKC